jgi:hypothetical protein
MIRIKSYADALALRGVVPEIVIERMGQFEGDDGLYSPEIHGHLVLLQEQDDISALPEVGPNGLLDVLGDDGGGYEFIDVVIENGKRVTEMVIQIDADKTIAVFIPDYPTLDERLRIVLEREAGV